MAQLPSPPVLLDGCARGNHREGREKLSLAQPTISGQLRTLEGMLGQKLFVRSGRHLVLTETGRLVYSYADEIFGIGRELLETLKGKRSTRRPARLMIGVADSLPKLVVQLLLAPVWTLDEAVQVICRDGKPERLLADLALHELDAILADAPLGPTSRVRAFSHLIGESPIGWFGVRRLAARYRRRFPQSLDAAPVLLPSPDSAVRRALDDWFEAEGLHPDVRCVCEDSALLKAVGRAGHGLFPAPVAIAREVCRQVRRHADRYCRVCYRPVLRDLGRASLEAPRGRRYNDRRPEAVCLIDDQRAHVSAQIHPHYDGWVRNSLSPKSGWSRYLGDGVLRAASATTLRCVVRDGSIDGRVADAGECRRVGHVQGRDHVTAAAGTVSAS